MGVHFLTRYVVFLYWEFTEDYFDLIHLDVVCDRVGSSSVDGLVIVSLYTMAHVGKAFADVVLSLHDYRPFAGLTVV